MTDSNRLNAVEEELTAIREATLAFIRVANSNNELIEQLAAGQQRNDETIEQLAAGQRRNDETIERLNQAIEQLTAGQQQLNQIMVQFAANAETDRAEIRKIWEYLLGQQSNGHGRS